MARRWPFPGDWKDAVANVLLVGIAYGLLCLAIGSLFLYGGAAFATAVLWASAQAGARALGRTVGEDTLAVCCCRRLSRASARQGECAPCVAASLTRSRPPPPLPALSLRQAACSSAPSTRRRCWACSSRA